MGQELELRKYKIKISRSEHVQGDPLLDCKVYTEENSYNDCLQSEINERFIKEIGCLPPPFTPDLDNMCNERFNLSRSKEDKIFDLVHQLGFQDWESKCRIPCTRSKYTKRYLAKESSSYPVLNLVFDRTVEVTHSTFSMNEQTLLTKLGGAVSSGRTLLWILVSILGAYQVIPESLSIFQNCTIYKLGFGVEHHQDSCAEEKK